MFLLNCTIKSLCYKFRILILEAYISILVPNFFETKTLIPSSVKCQIGEALCPSPTEVYFHELCHQNLCSCTEQLPSFSLLGSIRIHIHLIKLCITASTRQPHFTCVFKTLWKRKRSLNHRKCNPSEIVEIPKRKGVTLLHHHVIEYCPIT